MRESEILGVLRSLQNKTFGNSNCMNVNMRRLFRSTAPSAAAHCSFLNFYLKTPRAVSFFSLLPKNRAAQSVMAKDEKKKMTPSLKTRSALHTG